MAANVDKHLHTHLFIGGLHRSGKSLTHRLFCLHPSVSGFSGTGAPENEGQHLQTLYPPASAHGGPGRFAFDDSAHLTEHNRALIEACSAGRLWDCWAPYWDLSKPVLIEESPPNLIRARFLQAIFPGAKFIFVVRHPLAVSAETQKWSKQSITELIRHWVRAHQILLDDLAYVKSWAWFRYEDLAAAPERTLDELFGFAGLSPIDPRRLFRDSNSTFMDRTIAVLPRSAGKFLKFAGLSPRGPREVIEDRNSGYFSGISEPIDRQGLAGLDILEKFGYKLDQPYYERPPGTGSVILNSPTDPRRVHSST